MGLTNALQARSRILPTARSHQSPGLTLSCTVSARLLGSKPAVSARRSYATSDSLGGAKTSWRKQVTVRNDDGRVQWNDLTTREKAARTTQQTFNFGVVLAGLVGTVWHSGHILHYRLTRPRSLFSTSCILRSSPPIAKRGNLIALLIGSEPILEPSSFLGPRKRFEPLESLHQTNGIGIDRLRKSVMLQNLLYIRLSGAFRSSTFTDRTGIEHFRMHFNVRLIGEQVTTLR